MLPADTPVSPDIDTFNALARRAFDALPQSVRTACGRIAFRVADQAEWSVLADLDIDDPMDLTGLYVGETVERELASASSSGIPEVWLFRLPILLEWRERGDVRLDHLIEHVLIHEIAHHLGYDDEEIDELQGD
jgi:predicted Zn-dependent protease with MMP-like domain